MTVCWRALTLRPRWVTLNTSTPLVMIRSMAAWGNHSRSAASGHGAEAVDLAGLPRDGVAPQDGGEVDPDQDVDRRPRRPGHRPVGAVGPGRRIRAGAGDPAPTTRRREPQGVEEGVEHECPAAFPAAFLAGPVELGLHPRLEMGQQLGDSGGGAVAVEPALAGLLIRAGGQVAVLVGVAGLLVVVGGRGPDLLGRPLQLRQRPLPGQTQQPGLRGGIQHRRGGHLMGLRSGQLRRSATPPSVGGQRH